MSRAYLIDRLERMAVHEGIHADAWSRDLASAENDPKGAEARELDFLTGKRDQALMVIHTADLVRTFIEQLPDDADAIEALTRALGLADAESGCAS